MSIDPYSSPASYAQAPSFSAGSAVSQGVLAQLAGTKPWVRFMSVLMFLGAGLMLLFALIMLVGGGTFSIAGKPGPLPAWTITLAAGLYAVLSGLYIYPALKLWKYASRIGSLVLSGSMMDLETALSQQRSFWKYIGIMIIAILVLYFAIIIAFVAFGSFAAIKAQGI